jgi:UDP-glucose 4-epimerase
MSILLTGGAGYVGSHVVLALLDAGEAIVVLDDLSTGFSWAVPSAVKLVVGDVGDQPLVRRIIREHSINAILHFAASVVVRESIVNPLGYYLNNTVKSCALIECAVESGVSHFIFSSTAAVYGIPATNPVSESAVLAPISPYGTSKMMTEIMLRDTDLAYGMRYFALRYFNVAGADPKGRGGQSTSEATHLIKVAVQAALGQRPYVEIYGTDYSTPDGTAIRDYIHATDLARAHVAALQYLRANGVSEVLNCGYGRGYSVREVISAVERVSRTKIKVREARRRVGDPAMLVADVARIRKVLAWHPQLDDLDVIVGQALAWERSLNEPRAAPARSSESDLM